METMFLIWSLILLFLIKSEICIAQQVRKFECREPIEYDATRAGEIKSPFYDDDDEYLNGLYCEYKITAPEGYRIKITFKAMDIDPSGSCGYDRLVLYGKDKSSSLGTFCGHEIPKPILSKPGENVIEILFQTDFIVSGKGFHLQYESAPDFELCKDKEFLCRNRNCYLKEKKCDGMDDCGDGTDEEKCGKAVSLPSDQCGEPSISPTTVYGSPDRQVGGVEAVPNSWPWTVSLQFSNKEPNGHFCGGALVSPQWIVTAAHCVFGWTDPSELRIHLGSHSKYSKTKYEVIRVAERIISYPDLEGEKLKQMTIKHDIALIKMNAPVSYNDGIQPVCLPYPGWEAKPGWICYSNGWGETRGSGFSDVLKQTEQVVQSTDQCSYDLETQLCVDKTYNSPCHGDSGGPLVCKLGGKWFLMGTVSFGTRNNLFGGLCGMPDHKVVFSSVAAKADWIRQFIADNN